MSIDLGLKFILVKSHSSPNTGLCSSISSMATIINKKANIIIEVIIICSSTSQHSATYLGELSDWPIALNTILRILILKHSLPCSFIMCAHISAGASMTAGF